MPIEIKELHIRVSVNPPPSGSSAGDPKSPPAGAGSDEMRQAIVAECVEQVLQVLQTKSER
jgi:hypothetical protein